jgi:hypothetical protein
VEAKVNEEEVIILRKNKRGRSLNGKTVVGSKWVFDIKKLDII